MTTIKAAHSRLLKAHTQEAINEAINFVSARIDALADAEHRCQMLRDRARRASSETVGPYWSFLTDEEMAESGIKDAHGGPNSEAAIWLDEQAELADAERSCLFDLVLQSKRDLQTNRATIALAEFACRFASNNTSLFL